MPTRFWHPACCMAVRWFFKRCDARHLTLCLCDGALQTRHRVVVLRSVR